MKRISLTIKILLAALSCQAIFAASGALFDVVSTGTPGQVNISLCLNAKGILSCQQYAVQALDLAIRTTIPNHTYPVAGIKINTRGYGIANIGIVCTPISNGYCLFVVNNITPKMISLLHQTSGYTIGGTILGLSKTGLVLQNNGSDNLTVASGATSFQFPTTIPSGGSYNVTINQQPQGQICSVNNGTGTKVTANVTSINITCQNLSMVAVGFYTGSGSVIYPAVATSNDSGATWSYTIDNNITGASNVPDYIGSGSFAPAPFCASCAMDYCIFSGGYQSSISTPSNYAAIVAQGLNGGNDWSYKIDNQSTTPAQPSPSINNSFTTISCANSTCITAGQQNKPPIVPLIATSNDKGSTWQYSLNGGSTTAAIPPDYNRDGFFGENTTSCSGSNCIAVGSYIANNNNAYPMLLLSTNNGNTWTSPVYGGNIATYLPNYGSAGRYFGASCFGATCITGGSYVPASSSSYYPMLIRSKDGGNSWAFTITSAQVPSDYYDGVNDQVFLSTSCNNEVCMAAGQYRAVSSSGTIYPLLAVSTDNGDTWSYKIDSTAISIPNYSNDGIFNNVSCSDSICVAVGQYTEISAATTPLLAISTDKGNTWQYPSLPLPSTYNNGFFKSVSCLRQTCIAAGQYNGTDPWVFTSNDNGATWYLSLNAQPPGYVSDTNLTGTSIAIG